MSNTSYTNSRELMHRAQTPRCSNLLSIHLPLASQLLRLAGIVLVVPMYRTEWGPGPAQCELQRCAQTLAVR